MIDENNDTTNTRTPATDNNGIRKTFTTPELPEIIETRGGAKYPWKIIKVGESFEILHSEMKKTSVAPFVSKMGKKHGKKFKVTNHEAYGCYLVSCLPMEEKEAIATSSNLIEALDKMKKEGE